jgi:hypothetical protein
LTKKGNKYSKRQRKEGKRRQMINNAKKRVNKEKVNEYGNEETKKGG